MFKPRRGQIVRITKRERIKRNNAADAFYASCYDQAPKFQQEIPPLRAKVVRPVDYKPVVPLEKDIQTDIIDSLELRSDVVFCGRFNRGQAVAMNGDGSTRYTPFNSVPGFPDIHGLLVGGKAFYIEVKRPAPMYEKPKKDQQDFLDAAKLAGAYAGVATSIEEANAILPPC